MRSSWEAKKQKQPSTKNQPSKKPTIEPSTSINRSVFVHISSIEFFFVAFCRQVSTENSRLSNDLRAARSRLEEGEIEAAWQEEARIVQMIFTDFFLPLQQMVYYSHAVLQLSIIDSCLFFPVIAQVSGRILERRGEQIRGTLKET